MNALLELRGIRAAHERITVLHRVDLGVAAGEVVALLGPNGAGKTTTLRIAAGVHPAASGQLLLGGRDMTGADPRDLARATWPAPESASSPRDAGCSPTSRCATTS